MKDSKSDKIIEGLKKINEAAGAEMDKDSLIKAAKDYINNKWVIKGADGKEITVKIDDKKDGVSTFNDRIGTREVIYILVSVENLTLTMGNKTVKGDYKTYKGISRLNLGCYYIKKRTYGILKDAVSVWGNNVAKETKDINEMFKANLERVEGSIKIAMGANETYTDDEIKKAIMDYIKTIDVRSPKGTKIDISINESALYKETWYDKGVMVYCFDSKDMKLNCNGALPFKDPFKYRVIVYDENNNYFIDMFTSRPSADNIKDLVKHGFEDFERDLKELAEYADIPIYTDEEIEKAGEDFLNKLQLKTSTGKNIKIQIDGKPVYVADERFGRNIKINFSQINFTIEGSDNPIKITKNNFLMGTITIRRGLMPYNPKLYSTDLCDTIEELFSKGTQMISEFILQRLDREIGEKFDFIVFRLGTEQTSLIDCNAADVVGEVEFILQYWNSLDIDRGRFITEFKVTNLAGKWAKYDRFNDSYKKIPATQRTHKPSLYGDFIGKEGKGIGDGGNWYSFPKDGAWDFEKIKTIPLDTVLAKAKEYTTEDTSKMKFKDEERIQRTAILKALKELFGV